MRTLRTLASALCIVIAAVLIATWAASTAALAAIEDGTVIEDATARAIATESAQEGLVDKGTELALDAISEAGLNTDIPGVEGIVGAIVAKIVASEAFSAAVHSQTKSVRVQVVDQLNAGGTGPITVALDFSDQVNEQLAAIPVVGSSLPQIAVPAVPVQVMDAQTADTARVTWRWLHTAEQWFGLLGLAFLAVGVLVSYRKRWFFAKVALAVGVLSAVIWLVMSRADPRTVAEWLPGGGVVDAIIVEITRHGQATVAATMGWVAVGAMIGAAILFALARRGSKGESA